MTRHAILPHPELKWTIGPDGNWLRVPMILTRSQAGLKEQPVLTATIIVQETINVRTHRSS